MVPPAPAPMLIGLENCAEAVKPIKNKIPIKLKIRSFFIWLNVLK